MPGRHVDLAARVGSLRLPSPVMTASGTSGHGAELSSYGALGELGAVTVKSLSASPWPGNEAPRVHPLRAGMLNSVGLEGPGVAAWLDDHLPSLVEAGARVVVSLWGRTVAEFAAAATLLGQGLDRRPELAARGAGPGVVAVEVNVSCPNIEDRATMFAHSPEATARAVAASACGLPRWAKLSPNVTDLAPVAGAAIGAGAEALTLVNTLLGLAVDIEARRPVLGAGGGGLSGPALHPVAVRAVWECRQAFPEAGIVGVGGVAGGTDAVELLMAGADAVQVGTAGLAEPRAPWRVQRELARWCRRHRVGEVRQLVGAAQPSATAAGQPGDEVPAPAPSARSAGGRQ